METPFIANIKARLRHLESGVARLITRGIVPGGKLRGAKVSTVKGDSQKRSVAGMCVYDKSGAVKEIVVPAGLDAYDKTVRGHEGRHATLGCDKPSRKVPISPAHEQARQVCQDSRVEQIGTSGAAGKYLTKRYLRDNLATALRDLRGLRGLAKIDSAAARNGIKCGAVRILSMLRAYGSGFEGGKVRYPPPLWKYDLELEKMLGDKSYEAIQQIIGLCPAKSKAARTKGWKLLCAILENELDDDTDENERLPGDPDDDAPLEGEGAVSRMTIKRCNPMSAYTAKEKQVSARFAPDGTIINGSRYVNAIASGDPAGLFRRRLRRKPGGTVLIDASGSMHVCAEVLMELCRSIPTSMVAYYSGNSNSGTLWVYSESGKRYGGEVLPYFDSGNAVDLHAVRWLQRQPKPWTFVTDRAFCGGSWGDAEATHVIVEGLERRGLLRVIDSIPEALEHFGAQAKPKR